MEENEIITNEVIDETIENEEVTDLALDSDTGNSNGNSMVGLAVVAGVVTMAAVGVVATGKFVWSKGIKPLAGKIKESAENRKKAKEEKSKEQIIETTCEVVEEPEENEAEE